MAILHCLQLPIIEYLEETFPDKPILPKDPILRAHVINIILHIIDGRYLLMYYGVVVTIYKSNYDLKQ